MYYMHYWLSPALSAELTELGMLYVGLLPSSLAEAPNKGALLASCMHVLAYHDQLQIHT
jgi:hypothetical protein